MVRSIAVTIDVQADRRCGQHRPLWNWFGYDEPNYTYTEHGRKLLRELAALSPEPIRVRTHNLLISGDGTPALKWGSTNAYTEDDAGRPVYDWTIIDRIFDAYVKADAIPLIEIGFRPKALSDDPGPYQHSWALEAVNKTIVTGWAAPPNDLVKWSGLVEAWARHLVERYGDDTVSGWLWEVWNEPDGNYWTGCQRRSKNASADRSKNASGTKARRPPRGPSGVSVGWSTPRGLVLHDDARGGGPMGRDGQSLPNPRGGTMV